MFGMLPCRLLLAASLAISALAQCGPNGDQPYPPGSSTCPAGPGGGSGADGLEPTGCAAPPCAAALLNDVGLTTAGGTDARTGTTLQAGENIYGPFEAGFGAQQNSILESLGCSSGDLGHVAGGIDTLTAESMVAHQCGITLPRVEGNRYISLLDECGGHTQEYHFHERMTCLYTTEAGSGHSTQVGQGSDGKLLYGKWEHYATSQSPLLDACGAHFGVTPDSDGKVVYHYHVQDAAPFTFGCYGPISQSSDVYKMVTVAECRALYSGCGDGDASVVTTSQGTMTYDYWCPCWDADGSNVGSKELPVFGGAASAYTCTGSDCVYTAPILASSAFFANNAAVAWWAAVLACSVSIF